MTGYVVVWHVNDHAEGQFFDKYEDAKKSYDEKDGGAWAERLYDHTMKIHF